MSAQVTLTVPEGASGGTVLSVKQNGVKYRVSVPDGLQPGLQFTADLGAHNAVAPSCAVHGADPATVHGSKISPTQILEGLWLGPAPIVDEPNAEKVEQLLADKNSMVYKLREAGITHICNCTGSAPFPSAQLLPGLGGTVHSAADDVCCCAAAGNVCCFAAGNKCCWAAGSRSACHCWEFLRW